MGCGVSTAAKYEDTVFKGHMTGGVESEGSICTEPCDAVRQLRLKKRVLTARAKDILTGREKKDTRPEDSTEVSEFSERDAERVGQWMGELPRKVSLASLKSLPPITSSCRSVPYSHWSGDEGDIVPLISDPLDPTPTNSPRRLSNNLQLQKLQGLLSSACPQANRGAVACPLPRRLPPVSNANNGSKDTPVAAAAAAAPVPAAASAIRSPPLAPIPLQHRRRTVSPRPAYSVGRVVTGVSTDGSSSIGGPCGPSTPSASSLCSGSSVPSSLGMVAAEKSTPKLQLPRLHFGAGRQKSPRGGGGGGGGSSASRPPNLNLSQQQTACNHCSVEDVLTESDEALYCESGTSGEEIEVIHA
eukprot:Rhum_TRINITY_DN14639_c22_g1::Rhum_TRINITY_DN14639_c22_g1_i1::g.106817::m.106817